MERLAQRLCKPLRGQTKVAVPGRGPFAKRPAPAGWAAKKKAGHEARQKLRSDKSVKTFQRERPIRQRREEVGGAALNSAAADIGVTTSPCNAACLMWGLR